MRKIMFVGRSESGKTTIMQAMKGRPITYHKTQYVNNFDVIIDTPGEYAETKQLSGALAVYGCEADIIGLLMSAIEPFSLYPPNVVSVSNREVVGVVTKCDHWAANPELAAEWLRLAGCKKIFFTSSYTGEGIAEILSYLKEPVDKLPWEVAKAEYDKLGFGPGESEKHTGSGRPGERVVQQSHQQSPVLSAAPISNMPCTMVVDVFTPGREEVPVTTNRLALMGPPSE